jgi:FkbM family methyltransferase
MIDKAFKAIKRIGYLTQSEFKKHLFKKIDGKRPYYPDEASFISMRDEIFNKEIYKFNTLKKAPVILDCGANIGLSCIYFKRLHPQAKITAFEPDPDIFSYLKKNIALFGLDDVTLKQMAVSDTNGSTTFMSTGTDSGRIDQPDNGKKIKVETTKLAKFLDHPIDLLKMDIEGHEVQTLLSCGDRIQNVRYVFCEYHSFVDRPQRLDELLSYMREFGFRYHIHQEGVFSPQPFIRQNSYLGMDLQLNIFFFRKDG